MQRTNEREADLRALSEQLQFAVEQSGGRFTLTRTAARGLQGS
jgi:hypothetical protein